MAGKISELPSADPIVGGELIEIVQDGFSKKVAISDLSAVGSNGKSAYELAVLGGFQGTEAQWIASLAGATGNTGNSGKSAFELAVAAGYSGSQSNWLLSLKGETGPAGAQGNTGPVGPAGNTGVAGKTAYQLALDNGFVGDITNWLISLKGEKGAPGDRGLTGANGNNGIDGKSAYELAVVRGFVGSEIDWANTLVGPVGGTGPQGIQGATGAAGLTGPTGPAGSAGPAGLSAYAAAVAGGFVGDEAAWLLSLKGTTGNTGAAGTNGQSAYQIAVAGGFVGNEVQWITSLKGVTGNTGATGAAGAAGATGQSAYQLAVTGGYSGTLSQWITSLKGDPGNTGATGPTGPAGAAGAAGPQGIQGITGLSAYQSAVLAGYSGTEAAWLLSLKGVKGDTGNTGATGPTGAAGAQGIQGPTGPQGPQGLTGITGAAGAAGATGAAGTNGQSAYGAAVAGGFSGTQTQWLASLVGPTGPQGPTGATGATGPAGTNGTSGSSTVAQITNATTVGKAVMLASSESAGRVAMSAVGFDSVTKILDAAAKASLNLSGLEIPGVVNGIDYGVDWTGTETTSAFQNWITAAETFANARLTTNSKQVQVRLTCPQGAVIKLNNQIRIDIARVHLDLNNAHVVFTSNSVGGFLIKSSGYDVGLQGMYHQGKSVLMNGMISGPGRSTCTYAGVTFEGNTNSAIAYYECSPAGSVIENLSIMGFDKAITFDYWIYLITLVKIDAFSNNTSIYQGANFAGGERMAMRDSNLSGSNIGMDFTTVATSCEWMIENCSFDYNGVHIQWTNTTAFNLIQCHLEHGGNATALIQGLDGYQGGGVSLIQSSLVSIGYNTYPSYVKLTGRNFLDMDHCYFSNVRGITNELCSDFASRDLVGTVGITGGTATVTGVGTAFTTALAIGDLVTFRSGGAIIHIETGAILVPRLRVKSIESDTSLTLDGNFPAVVRAGTSTTNMSSITGCVMRANTKSTTQGGRVRVRNSKFNPNAFNDHLFVGGDITKNYLLYDATGGASHGFVEQAGNFVISSTSTTKPVWAAGVVTMKTNNPFPIPTGNSPINISGMVPAGYNGSFNATKVDNNTFTFPLPIDPGVVADGVVTGRANMGAVFGQNYGIRLGTGYGLTVVSANGYLEFRKNANYTGTNCAFWLIIPIPSAAFRNVVFGFDEVAIGSVGTVQVMTRWGAYPNVAYSGYGGTIPDDSMYNNNWSDPGGYVPSAVETTRMHNVPEYGEWSAAPENATHLVVKFVMSSLNNYAAGTTVYKIRNIRASLL